MKRIGHLFEQAFTPDALYQAWQDASHGKRSKRATLEFARNLGPNLDALHQELHAGSYRPQPYTFTQSAKRGALESVVSILGHAKHTASLRHLLTTLKANHHDLFDRIPPRCYANLHPYPTPA